MSSYFSEESLPTTRRYLLAYALFFIFALLGLALFVRVRTTILELCDFFSVNVRVVPILYTWGTYLLFVPYLAYLVWIESYMNKSAARNQVLPRAGKVLVVELALALLTRLITLLLNVLPHP